MFSMCTAFSRMRELGAISETYRLQAALNASQYNE